MATITGTVIATHTTRTMTLTVTEGDTVTEYTDTWIGWNLGAATALASVARNVTFLQWGIKTEWMLTEKTADRIVIEILDDETRNMGEETIEEDPDAWVMEDPEFRTDN
ncbi:hypothetical protein [Glycomyces sp. NPDC021274]|uniref:hypothetical protein n=1 Tax=Glycomyces sp. NPDC021274 TaxID=3155120 RepID=UPI0033FCD0CF